MPGWFDPENARLYGEARDELMAMYERLVGRAAPDPAGTNPATTMLTAVAPIDGEPAVLLDDASPSYQYSDPVDDPDWPQIQAADDNDQPDRFPEVWSAEPTERDQAAIDAGNA